MYHPTTRVLIILELLQAHPRLSGAKLAERLVVEGERAVTDIIVSDGVVTARAITFTTVRDGRIASHVEYWPDPFEAPAWRAAWVEYVSEQPGASPTV
ncbi:MAG TPA: hypothetical protein PKD53_03270 [Chloroflexaceae bacterium]|nr:hypothetical protein [Chloroflexaceae bacterium]